MSTPFFATESALPPTELPPATREGTRTAATARPEGTSTMTPETSQATPTAKELLAHALERAAEEMRAAETAGTTAEARAHAEAAVNILVGKLGRWYGDQDGDGMRVDPSDGRGVLPGEIVPQGGADLDNAGKFPAGLALLAAGTDASAPLLRVLLGDVDTWRTKPRAGYDAIENTVKNAGTSPNLDGLKGAVPRAVAFGRLILTGGGTMEEARALAGSAASELEAGVKAVP